MQLIDTHCHLNSQYDEKELLEVIERAKENGISHIFIPGFDINSSLKAIQLSHRFDFVYAIIGIHPCDCGNITEEDYKKLEELAQDDKVVAIGECGLDYYWKDVDSDTQKEHFIKQIKIAKKLNKPLVIHSRDAISETYQILKEYEVSKGIMHCYSGSVEMMKEFIKLGLYISLAGPVTFKNAKVPKEVAINVPINRLLIETDSPYLTPHPYRGKKNEPMYVKYVFEEIANLKDINQSELEKALIANTEAIFGKNLTK